MLATPVRDKLWRPRARAKLASTIMPWCNEPPISCRCRPTPD